MCASPNAVLPAAPARLESCGTMALGASEAASHFQRRNVVRLGGPERGAGTAGGGANARASSYPYVSQPSSSVACVVWGSRSHTSRAAMGGCGGPGPPPPPAMNTSELSRMSVGSCEEYVSRTCMMCVMAPQRPVLRYHLIPCLVFFNSICAILSLPVTDSTRTSPPISLLPPPCRLATQYSPNHNPTLEARSSSSDRKFHGEC